MAFEEASNEARNMFEEMDNPQESGGIPPVPESLMREAENAQAAEGESETEALSANAAVPTDGTADAPDNGQTQGQPVQNNNFSMEQFMQQQQAMFNQLAQENQQLKSANEELQKTITQQSDMAEENVNKRTMPVMDFSNLMYENEEVVRQREQEYAQDMADFISAQMEEKLKPFMDEANAAIERKNYDGIYSELEGMDEFKNIRSASNQIERIISDNPSLFGSEAQLADKIIAAYAMANGANALRNPPAPPKEPTVEDMMRYYLNNSDFREAVEKHRVQEISKSQQVPAMSASSGAVNAALNIKESPQTMDDASERAKAWFMKN